MSRVPCVLAYAPQYFAPVSAMYTCANFTTKRLNAPAVATEMHGQPQVLPLQQAGQVGKEQRGHATRTAAGQGPHDGLQVVAAQRVRRQRAVEERQRACMHHPQHGA
jgi:hypothetical protein